MTFLEAFHDERVDLERINRALIVLIPMTPAACTPSAYRPVSLQNCPVKVITKILTTRLQAQIDRLVDVDQTGFICGRSISENFVYATKLIQCCQQRRAPTLVIKLDFAKAFDSVNSESLLRILQVQGFPDKWIRWVRSLLTTSRSAVMVNGVPEPWITCKRGLRQGDTLSPYLFLLVANVLQHLIKRNGHIAHPLDWHAPPPCAVLQYADDTILVVCGDDASALQLQLKRELDNFAAAIGLAINFAKSTVTPVNVSPDQAPTLIEALGCCASSFPQTYLGLPLSNTKLRLLAFLPLIAKVDMYLARWKWKASY